MGKKAKKAGEQRQRVADMRELTKALTEALKPSAEDEADKPVTLADVVGAVAELAEKVCTLRQDLSGLLRKDAEAEIERLVAEGRIAQEHWGKKYRKAYVVLALSDRDTLGRLLVPPKAG